MRALASSFLPLPQLLLLILLTICGVTSSGQSGPTPFPLDEAAARAVLGAAMRCQNLSQLHAAGVHAGAGQLFSFQLELQPDGTVADLQRQVLLPVASVSKGMFASALPRVQEQLRKDKGDASFDLLTTPIKQLLGDADFWFLDHARTDAVTIEDLTSHTTGLTRHDSLSIWSGVATKAELARRAGRFSATGAFRGSYIYNNVVWTIADTAVERLIGANFTTYMRRFLWQPLGMADTIGSSEMESRGGVRQLHRSPAHFPTGRAPFERTELERSLDQVEAAGGIYAPLADMVKYMQHHTGSNYSSHLPPPEPFKAVNAFAAGVQAFDPRLMNESEVTDLPDIDRESYGHGWQRSWYRGSLSYEHGGAFFGAFCHLRVLPKRRLAVFSHASVGQSDSPYQAGYPEILGNYLTDMVTRNASFVNADNVCSLFKRLGPPGEPLAVPRRTLSQADVELCSGSFGNYGLGTVAVSHNSSSGLFNAAYGTGVLEMTPVQLPQRPADEYSFFLSIMRPRGFPVAEPIVGLNDSHVMLRPGSLAQGTPQTPLFARIWRQPAGSGAGGGDTDRLLMVSPALDAAAVLEKGLRPEDWRRPLLCPPVDKAASGVGGVVHWTVVAVLVVAAAAA